MKRILLDTNIIIERENPKVPNQSVARLFNILEKERTLKYIHPSCFYELSKYHDKLQVDILHAKLAAYNVIEIPSETIMDFDELLVDMTLNKNDIIDNQLIYQVYDSRVEVLITEDKKILKKANILKIRSKILTIDEYLQIYVLNNPNLIDYPVLSVRKVKFGQVNLSDDFFRYFRSMYPGFDNWFHTKFDEYAYVVNGENGLEGFLYIKTEERDEPYGHFSKPFAPKKRLKIGTFKVVSTGYRLGERFIKIIMDNALKRGVEEIYVTIFKNEEAVKPLVGLLESWGFLEYCINCDTNESVMIKNLKIYNIQESPKHNFPIISPKAKYFFLPIEQEYHLQLFPDSVLYRENVVDVKKPYQYALQKTYVSFAFTASLASSGDIMLIYRKGDFGRAGYTGVVSTIAIVEKVIKVGSCEQLLSECENRSVFSKDELIGFFNNQRTIYVVKLLQWNTIRRKVILKQLWESNIVEIGNGPRPFMQIEENEYAQILKMGEEIK